jgi:hypothetical protein
VLSVTITFRFALGQCVCWTDWGVPPQAPQHYWIVHRRWTERDTLGPVVEYLLRGPAPNDPALTWVYEADLTAWDAPDAPDTPSAPPH